MANERLSQSYAQAIFEQAAEGWVGPLKAAWAALSAADVETLDNPGLAFAEKQSVLERAIPSGTDVQITNLLSLLASRNEMHLLPDVISEFDRYSIREPLHPLAVVKSAVPLTEDERVSLEEKIRARFGQDTDFQYATDPSIIGGVVVRVGDKVIDGSVVGKLEALRNKLK